MVVIIVTIKHSLKVFHYESDEDDEPTAFAQSDCSDREADCSNKSEEPLIEPTPPVEENNSDEPLIEPTQPVEDSPIEPTTPVKEANLFADDSSPDINQVNIKRKRKVLIYFQFHTLDICLRR